MTQHNSRKSMGGVAATQQSCWPLDVLVASGWILAVASIGILLDDNLALSNHGFGKAAVVSILIGIICWLGGGLERRRTHMLGARNAMSHSLERKRARL
jgi:hypothetical protein